MEELATKQPHELQEWYHTNQHWQAQSLSTHLTDSGGKDWEVGSQSQGQRADGVQCVCAKLVRAAVKHTKKRMKDVGAVPCQVHAG